VHRLASGTLLTVDNAVDPNTGTVRLKAQFAKPTTRSSRISSSTRACSSTCSAA
jgi:multidrug efflux pump subunit AcrA (membrane-fusion protein)